MKKSPAISLMVMLLIGIGSSGCVQTYYLGRIPEAQFTYPNANVTPLNKVKGSSPSVFKAFRPPMVTSKAMSEAYSDAISKSQGADVLINADTYQRIFTLMLPYVPIFFSRYIVEGTAAKQEVGKQQLK
ncbi:MAG TPA: hypothetical protein VFE50_01045 [Cyclobacteriaceae bacterium]|nr:hypothetical protein [Cyclobacteriaceae bacterium]